MLNIYEREYKDSKYDKNITFSTLSKQIWKNLPPEKQAQYVFTSDERGNYYRLKPKKNDIEIKESQKAQLLEKKKKRSGKS